MKLEEINGKWVLIYLIENLILTDAVENEIRLNRVTLIKYSKFKRKCKSFGLPLYSELQKESVSSNFLSKLDNSCTLAIFQHSGKLISAKEKAEHLIDSELNVIAVSRLYAGETRPLMGVTIVSASNRLISYLAVNKGSSHRQSSYKKKTLITDLILDENWHQWQNAFFFDSLLTCLRKENGFDDAWRETILRAVSIASKGMTSSEWWFVFLHNMIALETILIRQGDTHVVELPKRLEAFLGWSNFWQKNNYPKKIKDVYGKRCQYVHDGIIMPITEEDVKFTDHLLHNVLNNILKHPKLFKSKDALIEFSEKISAERLLGISPALSQYFPKTFRFS